MDVEIDWDNEEEKDAAADLDEPENYNIPDDEENEKKTSRFIKFTDEEKENFVRGQRNNNTIRKTDGHIRLFIEFLLEQNEKRTAENIEPVQLNSYMENFLLAVRRKDHANYQPSSLQSMFNSIKRYPKEKKYSTDLKGPEFNGVNEILCAKNKVIVMCL